MEKREYKIIAESQTDHWWWLGRQRIIEQMVRKYCRTDGTLHIADVGSGLGANIPMLRRYGEVLALEPNEEAVSQVNAQWGSSGIRAVRWTSPERIGDRFDLILLADVLEHIPDDAAAVNWIRDHLKPGGHAVFTVPAHPHLWSEMDEVVHHQRRYRAKELRGLFAVGFHVRRFSFYNCLLYPVKLLFIAFSRLRRRLLPESRKRSFNETPPLLINRFFEAILFAESQLLRVASLPFGVSLIAVVQRAQFE